MMDALLRLFLCLVVIWVAFACGRAQRAAVAAFLAARAPDWVPGMEIRKVCGWGAAGTARELVASGLAEFEEYGTPEHRARRGGRPAFRYRWKSPT